MEEIIYATVAVLGLIGMIFLERWGAKVLKRDKAEMRRLEQEFIQHLQRKKE